MQMNVTDTIPTIIRGYQARIDFCARCIAEQRHSVFSYWVCFSVKSGLAISPQLDSDYGRRRLVGFAKADMFRSKLYAETLASKWNALLNPMSLDAGCIVEAMLVEDAALIVLQDAAETIAFFDEERPISMSS
jgi:hypothetical protein